MWSPIKKIKWQIILLSYKTDLIGDTDFSFKLVNFGGFFCVLLLYLFYFFFFLYMISYFDIYKNLIYVAASIQIFCNHFLNFENWFEFYFSFILDVESCKKIKLRIILLGYKTDFDRRYRLQFQIGVLCFLCFISSIYPCLFIKKYNFLCNDQALILSKVSYV